MSDVSFDHPRYLLLLAVVGAVGLAGVYGAWQRRRALCAFAAERLLPTLAPPFRWRRALARTGLVSCALGGMVVAAAGPRWGVGEQRVVTRGIDIMVLLDVSRSMLAKDIAPNRLERAKVAISDDLLPQLGGDRVGLIAFAGIPSLKCPLTNDYGYLRLVLDEISPRSSPRGGTLIGDAIRRAADAFDEESDNDRLMILITDGEDQDSFPVEAARKVWEERRIPVVALGLGDPTEGGRIPVETSSGPSYLEHDGKVVWTRADFAQLRAIAEASDLKAFLPVGTRDFDLGRIYRERILPGLRYEERVAAEQVARPARGHLFALASLALLLADSFLRDAVPAPGRRALTSPDTARRRSAAA